VIPGAGHHQHVADGQGLVGEVGGLAFGAREQHDGLDGVGSSQAEVSNALADERRARHHHHLGKAARAPVGIEPLGSLGIQLETMVRNETSNLIARPQQSELLPGGETGLSPGGGLDVAVLAQQEKVDPVGRPQADLLDGLAHQMALVRHGRRRHL
jgi:hypothetical protein